MGSNNPRRNHTIPQMLVRNFADEGLRLHVLNKKKKRVYKASPRKAFVENNRYVRYRDGGLQDDYEVEKELGEIEGAAAPAIRRIIASARKGVFPKLSPRHWAAWKRFFFTAHLRTPENATRIMNDLGSEKALDEAFDKVLQQQGLASLDRGVYDLDPQWANLKGMARHNNIATLAAGLPPQVNNELERYAHQVGLLVGVIQDPSYEFILGSCAGVVIASQGEMDSMSGSWLPISYDVAIGISAFPDRELLLPLGPTDVQRINNVSYEKSQIVAARTESHLRPFMPSNSK